MQITDILALYSFGIPLERSRQLTKDKGSALVERLVRPANELKFEEKCALMCL